MMNKSIDTILSQVYELEGLLLLVENHGKNTNSFVVDLIRKKAQTIADLSLLVEIETEVATSSYTNTSSENLEQENSIVTNETIIDNPFEGSSEKFELLGSDTSYDNEEEEINIEEVIDTDDDVDNIIDNIDDDDEIIDDEEIIEEENEINEEEEFQTEDSPIDIETSIEIPTPDEDEEDNTFIDDNDDDDDEIIIEEEEINDTIDDVLTVEQQLARHISRNIRQAFTLNDRFRYRRELFGNSDVEMTSTLNLVETMDSYAEAEDYFYGDKEWDSESPEVIDFMAIIRNHFA